MRDVLPDVVYCPTMLQLLVVAAPEDALLLRAGLEPLQSGSGSRFVATTEHGFDAVREQLWDAILLTAVDVPTSEALPLETFIDRAHGAPVIVIGRELGEDGAVELMHRGATDVISFARLERLPKVLQRELDMKLRLVVHRQASKTAHSWFASIVNHIPVGIAYHNERGTVVLCNQTALDLLGLTEDEYLGRSPFDPRWNICWENGETIVPNELPVARALRTKQPIRNVIMGVFRPRTNDRVWLHVDAIPILDNDGRLAHVVAQCSDITEQRRISDELLQSEERFRTAFEHSGIGLFLASLDLQILQANASASRILRRSHDDIIGKRMHDITHPDDVSATREITQSALAPGNHPVSFEKRYLDPSGNVVWAVVTLNTIRNVQGHPSHYVIAIEDITARKHAEAERSRLEAQLLQAKKLEALGVLAAAIAHDFNNILAAILCSADVLLQDLRQLPSAGEMPEIVFEMQSAAHRGADLVRQILTFSRRNNQRRAKLKLEITIEETLELVKKTRPSHLDVRFITHAKPSILADATQIQQALMNLYKNAFYGLEENSGNVTIELNSVLLDAATAKNIGALHEGLHAHLRIHDNGPIIDPETLEHISEPLYTTKSTGKGSGLGIAVVQGIVSNHDGALRIQSTPQLGTIVDIWLPAVPGETNERAPVKSAVPRGHDEHILIVDDEESLARVFGRLLQGIGYKTTVQTQALKALELFERDPTIYQAALVDLHMPAVGGVDVAKRLHALRPTMPIFIMSGYSDAIGDTPLESFGVVGILQKPVTRDILANELRTALDRQSQSSA